MTSPLADRLIREQRLRRERLLEHGTTSVSSPDSPDSPNPPEPEAASPAPEPSREPSAQAAESTGANSIDDLRTTLREVLGEWNELAESVSSLKAELVYREALEAICAGEAGSLDRALASLRVRQRSQTTKRGEANAAAEERAASAAPKGAVAPLPRSTPPAHCSVDEGEASRTPPATNPEAGAGRAMDEAVLEKLGDLLSLLEKHLHATDASGSRTGIDPKRLSDEIVREVVGKVRDAVRRDVVQELDSRRPSQPDAGPSRRQKLLRLGSFGRDRPALSPESVESSSPRVSLDDVPALIDILTRPK